MVKLSLERLHKLAAAKAEPQAKKEAAAADPLALELQRLKGKRNIKTIKQKGLVSSEKPVAPASQRQGQFKSIDPRFNTSLDKHEQRRFVTNYAFLDELRAQEVKAGKKVLKKKKLKEEDRRKLESHVQRITSQDNLRKRLSRQKRPAPAAATRG